jgi:hypothetical protein
LQFLTKVRAHDVGRWSAISAREATAIALPPELAGTFFAFQKRR